MTTKDQINFIQQKCVEANPEIVELKFGCEIELRDEDQTRTTYIGGVGKCKKHKKSSSCHEDCLIESAMSLAVVENDPQEFYELSEWVIERHETDLYRILGRPIRLADVFLAVGHNQGYRDGKMQASQLYTIVEVWNLRADDLEKQSEETINFLYELLK